MLDHNFEQLIMRMYFTKKSLHYPYRFEHDEYHIDKEKSLPYKGTSYRYKTEVTYKPNNTKI